MTAESSDITVFPVSGLTMSRILALFREDRSWTLSDLESMARFPNQQLVELFRRLRSETAVALTTIELRNAIESADQVVSMRAKLEGSDGTTIVVDDGDLIHLSVSAVASPS